MASNTKTLLTFLLIFTLLLAISAGHAVAAGRELPTDNKKPQSFVDSDGSVLVPGVGRFMLPRLGTDFNPFTYNPVTGTNGGTGIGIGDESGGATHEYVPGGDDTLVPNPGFEVPNPGSVGSTPAAARP